MMTTALGIAAEPSDTWDYADQGTETVPGAQLLIGDFLDDPNRPRMVTGFDDAPVLAVLGPGSRVVRCGRRFPRPVGGDEPVTVLLPRPDETA
jgi:hypothetical protein